MSGIHRPIVAGFNDGAMWTKLLSVVDGRWRVGVATAQTEPQSCHLQSVANGSTSNQMRVRGNWTLPSCFWKETSNSNTAVPAVHRPLKASLLGWPKSISTQLPRHDARHHPDWADLGHHTNIEQSTGCCLIRENLCQDLIRK